VQGRVKGGW